MNHTEIVNMLLVGLNLVLIESLLSIDNAAVLAAMVKNLPDEQAKKALKYGIFGAFFFRGLALLFVSVLMKVIWLKILGGAYLLYLTVDFFKKNFGVIEQNDEVNEPDAEETGLGAWFKRTVGVFWGTVALVEVMDLAFSVDNVFAAVALTKNMYVIITAVCIGIIAMRFVAQRFVDLMRNYPFLEKITFIVIGLLGVKLVVSGAYDYQPTSPFKTLLNSHEMDLAFSLGIIIIFAVPVLIARRRASIAAKPAPSMVLHG